MTILTDDLIEKAAEALNPGAFIRCHCNCSCCKHEHNRAQDMARREARAALRAILPDLVESAAKVAEGHDPNALIYRWVLARDIRSLLNKEDGNG